MIRRLLNTTVFRLSLVYALLFSLIAALAMGSIYWVAMEHIKQQTDTRLQLESDLLVNLYRTGTMDTLREGIKLRNQDQDRPEPRFYVYALSNSPQQAFSKELMPEYFTDGGRQLFDTLTFRQVLKMVNVNMAVRENDEARTLVTRLPGGFQLLVATDMSEQNALLDKMYRSIWLAMAVIFTLAILGGALMGYGVLRRIDSVRRTADNIINGDLSQRMTVTSRNDEFDRLSVVLNTMLQRLEQLMKATREVTDNLAHDLRNPLNRLRNRLEASRFQPPDSEHFQQLQQDALQDVDDLIKTFNALLGIAQAESGTHRDDWTDVNIGQLISDMGELYEAVAEEQDISFNYHADSGLILHGNRQLLAQAITNLLDNAVKYTPTGGEIKLHAERQANQIVITVSDSGSGIPAEQHERVFERFVRLDNARSTPGNGLGLSLVKAVADLHGASIELQDNKPGLRVILKLNASM